MNKTWFLIEKIIGSIIVIWGVIALYSVTTVVLKTINYGHVRLPNFSYLQVFKMNHLNFLLALASMFAGSLMIFNDKEGWLLSIICAAMYTLTFFMSARFNSRSSAQPHFDFFKSYSLMALLFLVFVILLIQKPFRKKYHSITKNWAWAIGILIVLIIDKMIF